jgi:hypothetical protein
MGDKEWLNNLTAFANATYINSQVQGEGIDRPLQGQSPYLINAGLQYFSPKTALTFTSVYNRIGQRIFLVGYQGYPDIYENARDVFDFQVSKKILKSQADLEKTKAEQDLIMKMAQIRSENESEKIKMDLEKKYITSDLYLTAYLKVKGFKFSVEKIKSKASFVFIQTPELTSVVSEFLTEAGSCEPLKYANSIKNIKNLLYNL